MSIVFLFRNGKKGHFGKKNRKKPIPFREKAELQDDRTPRWELCRINRNKHFQGMRHKYDILMWVGSGSVALRINIVR